MAGVVLITGASRGIGAATALLAASRGYAVCVNYRHNQAAADQVVAAIAALGGRAIAAQADVAIEANVMRLFERCDSSFGRLDALVNNASAFFPTPIGTATPAQFDTLFAANVRAPFFLAQAAAPHLRATRGAIVNLADIYADRPLRAHALYGMSKAALVHMTRALALELAPDIRVNAIAPGAILWPEDGKDDAAKQALLARTPLGRTGTPEEIAEAVRWLLRDAAYTTGQVLRLDGGRMLES